MKIIVNDKEIELKVTDVVFGFEKMDVRIAFKKCNAALLMTAEKEEIRNETLNRINAD